MNVFTKRFKDLFSSDLIYCIIFAAISLFSIRWFHGKDFILAGDLGWPLDFKRFFELTSYVWDSSAAPGYLAMRQSASLFPFAFYGYLFSLIGVSASAFQKAIYLVSFFFSGYGFYLMMRALNMERIVSFVSGLLYMLSPYALIVAWNPSYGQTFPFYAFLPLVLMCYIKYLKSYGLFSSSLFSGLFISLISFIGASFSNPAFFILLISCFLVFSILFLFNTSVRIIMLKTTIYISLYLLLNIFWLLPLVLSFTTGFSSADNTASGVVDDKTTQYINSVSYVDALKLDGFWASHGEQFDDYYYVFHEYWNTPFYIISSYFFLVISLVTLVKNPTKKHAFLLLAFLFIIFLVAGLKGNRLLKNFSEVVYYAPYFSRIFRSVYLKFGVLLVLFFCTFFGIVMNNRLGKLLVTMLLVILFVNSRPFFNGDIIKPQGKVLPSYAVSFPQDYYNIAKVINRDPADIKVLMLPIPNSYNSLLLWDSSGYNGAEFLRSLLDKPLYYVGGFSYNKDLSRNLNADTIGRSGVKYIIFRKDVYPYKMEKSYLTPDLNNLQDLLSKEPFSRILKTQYLELYELKDSFINPVFYTNDSKDSVLVEKINPIKFRVSVLSSGDNTTLVFNEGFDPTWKLMDLTTGKTFASSDIDGINTWKLSGFTRYDLIIYNSMQGYFYVGLFISSIVCIYVFYRWFKFLKGV